MHVTDLIEAVKTGNVPAANSVLDRDPDALNRPGDGGVPPLMVAIYWGQPSLIDLLLSRGARVDIFAATSLGDVDLVRRLLDEDPALANAHSADGWTPLHLAAHFGQEATARLLLERGADIHARSTNNMGNTSLHAAAASAHAGVAAERQAAVMRLLLQRGADLQATDSEGATPAQLAAHEGGDESVLALLGAELTPKT